MDSPPGLGLEGKLLPSRHPAVGVWQLRRVGPPSTIPNSASLIRLCEDGQVTIGRGPTADYFVDSAITLRLISRIHASIIGERQANGIPKFTIVNSGLNGTYINDYKMGYHSENRRVLHEGDKVTFGHPGCASIQPGELAPQQNSEFQFILEHVPESSLPSDNTEHLSRAPIGNGGLRYNLLAQVGENPDHTSRKQEVRSVIVPDHRCPRLSVSPQSNASTSEKENVLVEGDKCGPVRNTRSPTFDTHCAILPSKYENIKYCREQSLELKDDWTKKLDKKSSVQGLVVDQKIAAYDILSSSLTPPKCMLFNGVHEVASTMHRKNSHSQSSAADSYKGSSRFSNTAASTGVEELTKMSPSLFRTDGGGVQVNSTTIILRDDDNGEENSCDDAPPSSPDIEFVGASSWVVPTRIKVESASDESEPTLGCGRGKTSPPTAKELSPSRYAGSGAGSVRSCLVERQFPDKSVPSAVSTGSKPSPQPAPQPTLQRKLSQDLDLNTRLETHDVKGKSEQRDLTPARAVHGKASVILPASDYRIVRGELLQTATVSSSSSSSLLSNPDTAEDSLSSDSSSDDSSHPNKPSLSPASSSSSDPASPPTLSPQTHLLQTPHDRITPQNLAPTLTLHSSSSSNSTSPSSSDSDSMLSGAASARSSTSRASDSRSLPSSNPSGEAPKKFFLKDVVPNMYTSSDDDEVDKDNRTKEIVKKIFTPKDSRQRRAHVDIKSESAISENGEGHLGSKVNHGPSRPPSSASSSSLSSKASSSKKLRKTSPPPVDSDSLESSPSSSDLSDLESVIPKKSTPPSCHDTSSNPRPLSKKTAAQDGSSESKRQASETTSRKPASLKPSPSRTSLPTLGDDGQARDKAGPKQRGENKNTDASKSNSLHSSGNPQKSPSKSSASPASKVKPSSSTPKGKLKPEPAASPAVLSSPSSKNSVTSEASLTSVQTLKPGSSLAPKLDVKQVQRVLLSVKGLPTAKSSKDGHEKKTLNSQGQSESEKRLPGSLSKSGPLKSKDATSQGPLKSKDASPQGGSTFKKHLKTNNLDGEPSNKSSKTSKTAKTATGNGDETLSKSSKAGPHINDSVSKPSKTAAQTNDSKSKSSKAGTQDSVSKTAAQMSNSISKSSKTEAQMNNSISKSSKTEAQMNNSISKSSKTEPHMNNSVSKTATHAKSSTPEKKSTSLASTNLSSPKRSSDSKPVSVAPSPVSVVPSPAGKSSKPNGVPSKGSNSSPLVISSSSSATSVVGTPKGKNASLISLKDDTDFMKALTSTPPAKKVTKQKPPAKSGAAKSAQPPEKSIRTGTESNTGSVFKKKNFIQSVGKGDAHDKRKEPVSDRSTAATAAKKSSSISNYGDGLTSERSAPRKSGSRPDGPPKDDGKSFKSRESRTTERGKLSRTSSVSSTNSSTRRKRRRSPSKKGKGRPPKKKQRKKFSDTSSEDDGLDDESQDEDMDEPSEDWSLPDGVQYYDNLCSAAKCLNPVGSKVDWVMCDSCEQWYHVVCVDCPMEVIQKENIQFHCGLC